MGSLFHKISRFSDYGAIYILKELNSNMIKNKRLKTVLKIAGVIISIFIILFVVWIVRYNLLIKPLLSNEKLQKSPDFSESQTYEYNDEETHNSYLTYVPKFPMFSGNISCATSVEVDDDFNLLIDYNYAFAYTPSIFGEKEYWFNVFDYTECEHMSDTPETYCFITDSEFNLIEQDGTCDADYEDYKETLMEFFYNDIVTFYGEEIFEN